MPRITVGRNVDLYYQDWGAGKAIVLIHGWPLDGRMFEYHMLELAKRDCRVVSIDLRGFGQSDKPWEGNDYDTWAGDIGKVIASLILRDVTLAGFGMGGSIVAHYVARRIDTRISKLALISAPLLTATQRPEDRQMLDEQIKSISADRPKFVRDYIKSMMHAPISSESLEWLASLGRTASLRAMVRGLEEMRDRDLRPMLGNIRIPTRFFHGEIDQIIPASAAESQAKLIKGASLVMIEDCGHAVYWDARDRLIDELEKFAAEKIAKAA